MKKQHLTVPETANLLDQIYQEVLAQLSPTEQLIIKTIGFPKPDLLVLLAECGIRHLGISRDELEVLTHTRGAELAGVIRALVDSPNGEILTALLNKLVDLYNEAHPDAE